MSFFMVGEGETLRRSEFLTTSPSHHLTLFKIKFFNREERKSTSFFVSLRIIKKKKHYELYGKNVAVNGIKR